MIRSKNRVIGIGLLSGLLILGAGQQALAQEGVNLARNDQQADIDVLRMYFSDENLVEVTTRAPQPLPRVAENVTIISAQQIEEMGYHSIDEVLSKLAGMVVVMGHRDMVAKGSYRTHGLIDASHVLILIDGVRINSLFGGEPYSYGVPLQIVKRIEVVKGPVSAVWGSALGGAINIITKDTGNTAKPEGQIKGSYGEARTQDYNADTAVKTGPFSYYLYAGRQDSQGLREDRWFYSKRFYGKVEAELGQKTQIGLVIGHSEPYYSQFYVAPDNNANGSLPHSWGTLSIDSSPAVGIDIRLSLNGARMDYTQNTTIMYYGDLNSYSLFNNDKSWGCDATVAINRLPNNSIVLGAEIHRGQMEYFLGDYYPNNPSLNNTREKRVLQELQGYFINDSISWGDLTVTPGIRFDQSSLIGDQTSPSLAVVYRLTASTLIRATVARGFANPPLYNYAFDGSETIKPEKIASMQGGVETSILDAVRFRATIFHHNVKDTWGGVTLNGMHMHRDGVETEIETNEYKGFSANANGTYIHEQNPETFSGGKNDEIVAANLVFAYNDHHLLRVRLQGSYLWLDTYEWEGYKEHDFSGMIWDATFGGTPFSGNMQGLEFFGAVHNIFSNTVYWGTEYKNPARWVEVGVSITY